MDEERNQGGGLWFEPITDAIYRKKINAIVLEWGTRNLESAKKVRHELEDRLGHARGTLDECKFEVQQVMCEVIRKLQTAHDYDSDVLDLMDKECDDAFHEKVAARIRERYAAAQACIRHQLRKGAGIIWR